MTSLRHDLQCAFRGFRRSPGITAVVMLSLGLAMAATTATFSLVQAVVLRPLPLRAPDRLVMIWTTNMLNGALEQYTSIANLADWKALSTSFDELATYREADGPVLPTDNAVAPAEWMEYTYLPADALAMLGRSPAIGRLFTNQEMTQEQPVVLVSYRLWRRLSEGGATVIGRRLNISGLDAEVIGVMPADFWFPSKRTDLWLPATLNPRWRNSQTARATRFGPVIGRLKPATSIEQARIEMTGIADRLRRAYPSINGDLGVNLMSLQDHVNGPSAPTMMAMLFGAVMFVLMMACANVANLQLARVLARRSEIAVRLALGGTRQRIINQLLTESVLLSLAAGVVGLGIAVAAVRVVPAFAPAGIARIDEVRIDGTVALFSVVLSAVSGVLSGLLPAIRFSRRDVEAGLRSTGRMLTGDRSVRTLRAWLVATEFALAVVLLVGAGLLIRSLLAVRAVDAGFGNRSAVTAQVRFHTTLSRAQRVARYRGAIDRLSALPGVRAVGGISTMFWNDEVPSFGLRAVDGRPAESRDSWAPLVWTTVSGNYFQAIGVPLLMGRFFTDQDRLGAPPVVVINASMARRFWPDDDPIGKRIKGFDPRGKDDDWVTVIGVVKDVRSRGLEETPVGQIFEAQAQTLDETADMVISTAAPVGIAAMIRETVRATDGTAVVDNVSTIAGQLDEQSSGRRFETYLLIAFGALALTLAAAGIFGLLHYSVLQRTAEIGIRVAIGARRSDIVASVVSEGLRPAAIGASGGFAAAYLLATLMRSMLFGIRPYDPMTLAAVGVLLAVLAVLACWFPAVRAASVDPLQALRGD